MQFNKMENHILYQLFKYVLIQFFKIYWNHKWADS
jgi:hypothetical protein